MLKKNIGAPKDATVASPMQTKAPGARPLDDWDHQNNADALMKAQEIMGDPDKMKGAMIHIKKKAKAIRSIKDITDFHNEKYGAGGNPDLEVE
jgi:hypothetical protein